MKMIKNATVWIIEDELPKEITLEEVSQSKGAVVIYPSKTLCVKTCMYMALEALNRDIDDVVYVVGDDGKPLEIYLSDLLYNTIALENNNRPHYFDSYYKCNHECLRLALEQDQK